MKTQGRDVGKQVVQGQDVTKQGPLTEEMDKHRNYHRELVAVRTVRMGERIEELTCVYGIPKLVETPNITVE